MKLAQRLKKHQLNGEAFNFGPNLNDNLSVLNLLKLLQKNLPDLKFSSISPNSQIIEHKLLYLDTTKAQKVLSWKTKMTIESCVVSLADWYRAYLKKPELLEKIMEEQIIKYWNL